MTLGIQGPTPPPIWAGLFTLAALAFMTEGYLNGLTGSRRSVALFAVASSFSLIIVLIADLDSPRRGLLQVKRGALEEVLREMR